MRDLAAALAECNAGYPEPATLSLELTLDCEHLYTRCVAALEQSHAIWLSSRITNSERARSLLLKQRKTILEEVKACVKQFSRVLEMTQTLCASESIHPELGLVRAQLEQNLKEARCFQETAVSVDTPVGSGVCAKVPRQSH